jgi:hypothetical protein
MKRLIRYLLKALEKLGRNVLLSDNSKKKEYDFVWKHFKPRLNPMWNELPQFEPVAINYRRPPLYYFMMYGSRNRLRVSAALNILQCNLGLKKYWTFDAYTIVLENRKPF